MAFIDTTNRVEVEGLIGKNVDINGNLQGKLTSVASATKKGYVLAVELETNKRTITVQLAHADTVREIGGNRFIYIGTEW